MRKRKDFEYNRIAGAGGANDRVRRLQVGWCLLKEVL
jgi:hypothetical protein